MPLETIGSYALAGSSGTVARGARSSTSDYANAAFAASQARGGKTGGNIELPSPAPNVAAYVSPFIRLDLETRLAILEFRDAESGRVEQQYPSPRVVREYQQNLPDNSDLRADETEQNAGQNAGEAETGQVEIIGGGQTGNPTQSVGATSNSDGPAPVAPAIASAARAAFAAPPQNAPAGNRQLAVA